MQNSSTIAYYQLRNDKMNGERKINLCEGQPLNSSNPGAANIFLSTGKNTKVNSPNGTVIHLQPEKQTDVDLHINTTFSIGSSKKIKLLFVLSFLLSLICMIISLSVAYYYWSEMTSMRKQIDSIKDQLILLNFKDSGINTDKIEQSPLVSIQKPKEFREPRMEVHDNELSAKARTYFVENLGEDMLLVDASKKPAKVDTVSKLGIDIPLPNKDPFMVVHFNGASRELNLGTKAIIGPWSRDVDISSKNSETKIELHTDYVTVKEGGLYLVYAQVVYLTHAPNNYFVWARQDGKEPRLLSSCATGDDSSRRPLDKSQISCSVQTMARLLPGDTVNLAQREHNRTLWLRPGHTYFGFVKLSS